MTCSISTKLAAEPASSRPRVLKRVPACSHERRAITDAVSTPPAGSITCSVCIDACMIGVSHGPPPASTKGSSAARFHTKRGSAASKGDTDSAAASEAACARAARLCTV